VFRIRHIRLLKLQTVGSIRRRANLNFLNELENNRASSSTERTTENLVPQKPGGGARRHAGCVRHESEESQTSHNGTGIASGLPVGTKPDTIAEVTKRSASPV
jgi:hypothetical protein